MLHTLAATQDVPRHTVSTREEARESRSHPEEPRFRLLALEEGSFPCVVGKEFPAFLSHLKRRHSPQERREELQVTPPFPESPRCLSTFQGNLFPWTASTFKPMIDSHHGGTWDSPVGKPRGKASWESLMGKPHGKASRESHRSLDPREGKRDSAATAREERARAYPH